MVARVRSADEIAVNPGVEMSSQHANTLMWKAVQAGLVALAVLCYMNIEVVTGTVLFRYAFSLVTAETTWRGVIYLITAVTGLILFGWQARNFAVKTLEVMTA